MSDRLTLEELLGNDRWLRALARRLTGGLDADDAVQETWLVAAHTPPTGGSSPRAWLATVLRNILRMRTRSNARRAQREESNTAGDEFVAAADSLLQRVEVERRLAALVLGLAEPIRSTVLLRYYEGLSAAAIARRLHVPAGTVRWRLKEGLDRLRRQLDEQHGSRRAWCLWLGPISGGALLMKTTTQAALVIALLLALFGAATWRRHRPADASPAVPSSSASRSPQAAPSMTRPAFGLVPGTIRRDGAAADARVEGRVLSVQSRQGVASATVSFASAGAIEVTTASADGSFRFTPAHEGTYEMVGLTASGFVPQQAPPGQGFIRFVATRGVRISDVTLFVYPIQEVVATVLDERKQPVPGAIIRTDTGGPPEAPLRTDAAGQCGFPAFPGMLVEATSKGRLALARIESPIIARGTMVLTLSGASTPERPIQGIVLDGNDRPVSDVMIEARGDSDKGSQVPHQTSSSADGRFTFEPLLDGSYTLVARATARAPAFVRGVRPGGSEVVLRLAGGGSIRGTVSRRSSGPLTTFAVWAESEDFDRRAADGTYQQAVFDADGQFLIEGVAPGAYRVQVRANGLARSAMQRTEVRIERTSELQFTLGEGAHVRGRVNNIADGRPIAGARVFYDHEEESAVLTRADGTFDLAGIPPGIRAVEAAASGYRASEVTRLRVTDDASLDGLSLALRRANSNEGEHLEFAGLGMVPNGSKEGCTILDLVPNGGGAAAGLQIGDLLLSLDGTPLHDLELDEIGNLLRGPEGTTVSVTYRRGDVVGTVIATRKMVQ